jgi:phage minor structural protein
MKVFEAKEKEYKTNGLGFITPLKCIETKKKSLNGWYVEASVSSDYSDIIINDNIIVIETKEKGPQPFRIRNPETNNSIISFTADHVVFDTARYTVDDVRPTNLIGADFLQYINARLDTTSPFTFDSDIPTRKTRYFIRKDFLTVLEETEETFEGEYDIDNYHIDMRSSVSRMSDECLIYGKNIQGLKKYEDWSEVCTKILPEGPDGLLLPEVYVNADVQYDIPYTRNVSFSLQTKKEDDTEKTEAELITELRASAISFLNEHKYPKVNYTITSDINQELAIGDIIPVKHPLAIIETAVQEYRYDVLKKRVISIVYGNYERNVKKAFGNIANQIEQLEKKSSNFLTEAMNTVAYLMNIAGKNGSIVFRKNNKGVIYEILAMDTDSMETAKTVMRLNNQGLAGSTNGVNGPYSVAVMANGSITADAILSGILRSIEIMNGDGTFHVDKQGNVTIKKGTFNLGEGNFIVDQDGNVTIKKGAFNIAGNFIVNNDGSLTAKKGEFTGSINANDGNIGGWNIDSNGLYNGTVKIKNSGITNIYTWADVYMVRMIVSNVVTADADMISHYDFNGDGKITSADYVILKNRLKAM